MKAEIVALARRHAIITPYTAGLVVEDRTARGFRVPSGGMRPGMRAPADPEPPTPPPGDPGGPTSSSAPLHFGSRELRDRQEGVAVADRSGVRTVADKTFRRDGDRWVDTVWDGAGEPTRIAAFSRAYFDLVASDDRIARYLSVGTRVVLVLDGTVYEIVPEN